MREIIFRGKRSYNGEWIEGFYSHSGDKTYIIFDNGFAISYFKMKEVITETVGQFTGKTDKNGKKIFEGDIVKTESDLWHGENRKERIIRIGYVIYDEKSCQFLLKIKEFPNGYTLRRWKGDFNEVIGNIHDNPELLEEEKK